MQKTATAAGHSKLHSIHISWEMRFQQPQKALKLDTCNILVHWQQAETVISAHEAIIISLKLLKG
jgi:hypothetical protein